MPRSIHNDRRMRWDTRLYSSRPQSSQASSICTSETTTPAVLTQTSSSPCDVRMILVPPPSALNPAIIAEPLFFGRGGRPVSNPPPCNYLLQSDTASYESLPTAPTPSSLQKTKWGGLRVLSFPLPNPQRQFVPQRHRFLFCFVRKKNSVRILSEKKDTHHQCQDSLRPIYFLIKNLDKKFFFWEKGRQKPYLCPSTNLVKEKS